MNVPLVLAALQKGLPGAAEMHYPPTHADAAAQWASAMQSYASGIIPPSTTVVAAAEALRPGLETSFVHMNPYGLEFAFALFAAQLGAGMTGYVPTPPPGLVGFADFFKRARPLSRQQAIDELALLIDTWMRTGTATLAATGAMTSWQ